MKKLIVFLMIWGVMVVWGPPARAVPFLQLDISDGVYDNATETVFSTGEDFSLYALINPKKKAFDEDETYYISAAVVSESGQVDPNAAGSFMIDGKPIDVAANMTHGTPKGLSPHGIFETYYAEFEFELDPSEITRMYNSQDSPGGLDPIEKPRGCFLYYYDFAVNVGDLDPGYAIHFDLYTKNADGSVNKFAPFSHDAQSYSAMVPVPEPATILLVGAGLLVGLMALRKKRSR